MATKAPASTISSMPTTLGACIDLLYTHRAVRLAQQKKVDEMKKIEDALEAHILANFAASELDGAKGNVATAAITRRTQATILDFEKFVRWVVKHKAFSALQKRVGITAVREYWDEGKKVDGLESLIITDLSLTKAGK
jgi:hypothetical protein